MGTKNIPLEANITKNIIRYLNSLPHTRVVKRKGGRDRGGEPDIYGSYYGRHIELEVKRPKIGIVTERQKSCMRKWKEAHAIVAVVTSVQEVKVILDILHKEQGGE